ELPLPGGVGLLRAPVDARLRAGILELPLRRRRLRLELLARHPGSYRLLPARVWLRSDPNQRGTTGETRLEVTAD
ncbi:MAG TPA: hypothetical protein DEA08_36310, partial [Planctomycetes bacterium]|nr:hypothetical protein [Planctomycetota bacterium]